MVFSKDDDYTEASRLLRKMENALEKVCNSRYNSILWI